jgi:HSP20 family protein
LNMMYRSLFPRDVLAELDRLQREMQQAFHLSPSIRGIARGGFPAMNVGGTPQSVEIYAFAPGIDPATLDVQIEKGVLTVAGERKRDLPGEEGHGAYRRAFRRPLPARRHPARRCRPNAVDAKYRDGVLRISIGRKQSAQPRRITIQ